MALDPDMGASPRMCVFASSKCNGAFHVRSSSKPDTSAHSQGVGNCLVGVYLMADTVRVAPVQDLQKSNDPMAEMMSPSTNVSASCCEAQIGGLIRHIRLDSPSDFVDVVVVDGAG